MIILTVNCGSSSLKIDVFDTAVREPLRLATGSIEDIAPSGDGSQHEEEFARALEVLGKSVVLDGVEAVGHRVVHGGTRFRGPTVIDDGVVEALEQASRLAPLHNAPAIRVIEAARARFGGGVPQVASFDTAFFADLPEAAATYALPQEIRERHGIRRFGFHGLAHRYMAERYAALHPEAGDARLVTLQLGNGASAAAVRGGRPVDTSMGFTPLEGLVMGTRSGDIDPSVPLVLVEAGMTAAEVDALLNTRSGLLGLSGRTNEMSELLAAAAGGDERALLAVDVFCYRVRKYIGAYAAALAGLDAVIFGGGIGERSPEIRARICKGMEWAGLVLDDARNQEADGPESRISAEGSAVGAWVVAVDEASVIAADVAACIAR